ncbi:MAG: hypothetical protein E6K68_10730 [Nitrospirae bacterium]|nr:MAG: hypothetical protein E6K68_10730 [Nitrospirota bacterium]
MRGHSLAPSICRALLGAGVLAVLCSLGPVFSQSLPTGGQPDPTLLPVATTSQVPLTTAYNALNVPAIAAGGSYLDPTTGVKVYKITSATFPTTSSGWWHDYAEGGDEVSLPYKGTTRAVLVNSSSGYWIADFTPGVGVSNGRALTGSFVPVHDQAFVFSTNPATPYYAYVSNGSSIRRIDIRTMTEAPGDGWPVLNEPEAVWLQQSENDAFFTWMRGQSGPVVVGYEPATSTLKTQTVSNVDQPQIDRNASSRYVAINTTPQEGLILWDFSRNVTVCTAAGDPGPQFNHMAALHDRWMGLNWNTSAPHNYDQFLTDCSNENLGSPANANDYYANGSWNQHPASLDDQWVLFSTQEGLTPGVSGYLAPGGMIFVTANGQRRLLGHPYNTSTNYTTYSFARLSADGRYVMFTADMNGSGRSDVFLAEVPLSAGADTTPPTVSMTAPTSGATVSGTVTVSASASDNAGVVGVQFKLDGANLGAEDTTSPFLQRFPYLNRRCARRRREHRQFGRGQCDGGE